jgi:hypothetical protein
MMMKVMAGQASPFVSPLAINARQIEEPSTVYAVFAIE